LFLAKNAPQISDYLVADYCFLTDGFPYALRPDAQTAVMMHDLFSSRRQQFTAMGISDSVATLTEDEERAKLSQANCVVAAQKDQATIVSQWLPYLRVLATPMAAKPVSAPQPGEKDLLLFVGSSTAANVDGLRWFFENCWSQIRKARPYTRFYIAGTISQDFGPAPPGAKFLGLVDDLTALYRQAGVVVSPLRVGSGLKIKLIEALEHGKAVVASPITLQGVADLLADAVRVADNPLDFISGVISLLDDEKLRIDLASRALGVMSQHFSAEKCYGPFVNEIITQLQR
jgi:succinoglycan biosynthesis protein ExoO